MEPTVFLVDRIRDGRSFATRLVTGIQDGQAIFTMSASFHVQDEGIEHQDEMPPVPDPETLAIAQDSEDPETAWLAREWSDWDLRMVPKADIDKRPGAAAQQQVWFRSREALPDDPVFHVCTLAYMSDMTLARIFPRPPTWTWPCKALRSITPCGSCGRSAPTSGCCTTRRRRQRASVAH